MALKINDLCIDCDVCESSCPNDAISQCNSTYLIDPERCTECVGHFEEPQCLLVCPVACIEPDPEHYETRDDLLLKLAGIDGR